jgi:hypothetical protein
MPDASCCIFRSQCFLVYNAVTFSSYSSLSVVKCRPRAADMFPWTARLINVGRDQPPVPCFRWILKPVCDWQLNPDEFNILKSVLLYWLYGNTDGDWRKRDGSWFILRFRRNSCLAVWGVLRNHNGDREKCIYFIFIILLFGSIATYSKLLSPQLCGNFRRVTRNQWHLEDMRLF